MDSFFPDIVDVSPQRDGNPLDAMANELLTGALGAIGDAGLEGVVATIADQGNLKITIGDPSQEISVVVMPYLGDDSVLSLSVLRHDEPVHNGELDARGYVSGRKDVNVPIDFGELLAELRFLCELFTQENS
jgi:hypothetical protein